MGQVNCETTSEPTPTVISLLTLSLLSLTHNQSPSAQEATLHEHLQDSVSQRQAQPLISLCVLGKIHLLSTVGSWRDDSHLLRASRLPYMELTCPVPGTGSALMGICLLDKYREAGLWLQRGLLSTYCFTRLLYFCYKIKLKSAVAMGTKPRRTARSLCGQSPWGLKASLSTLCLRCVESQGLWPRWVDSSATDFWSPASTSTSSVRGIGVFISHTTWNDLTLRCSAVSAKHSTYKCAEHWYLQFMLLTRQQAPRGQGLQFSQFYSWRGNGNPVQYSYLGNRVHKEPSRLQSMALQKVGHDLPSK